MENIDDETHPIEHRDTETLIKGILEMILDYIKNFLILKRKRNCKKIAGITNLML